MYRCRVEKDSISPEGKRITSFVIEFPRVVLAEVVTHRMVSDVWTDDIVSICERTTTKDISKNSASSRAIPAEKMIRKVMDDPYMPKWTINKSGMQGQHVTDESIIEKANEIWLASRDHAVNSADELSKLGIHKQDCNRLLEQWVWVTQIVTATEWDNFFALRCHKAAHPAFQRIARMMFLARKASTPRNLTYGQWHLPFIHPTDEVAFNWQPNRFTLEQEIPDLIKYSAARCAWISYANHEKDGTTEQMKKTFDRLLAESPMHASPVEHQATPIHPMLQASHPRFRSNFQGWLQARKLIPHEKVVEYNPSEEEIASWEIPDFWSE
jgi:thymidylate synthase ThyX